jgi:hypothetical protein
MPNEQQVILNGSADGVSHYEEQAFAYDHSIWSVNPSDKHFADQEAVFETVGTHIMNNGLDGFNATLFCYGQTGSGKTYTVLGSEKEGDEGLLPRIAKGLFSHIGDNAREDIANGMQFTVHVSYLQIYNETIQDLLIPAGKQQSLEVRHYPKLGNYVPGLTDNIVHNYRDVQRLLRFGSMTRSVAATNMNNESSRSHCIFTIQIEKEEHQNGMQHDLRSKVNLVDLAGAERQQRARTSGIRLKEGAAINQSLSNLALVIHSLAEQCSGRKTDHVPFRNSKLTHFLQESLSGNSKTCMLANIAPSMLDFSETLSTLRFAKTCKKIRTQAVQNMETKGDIVQRLNNEIEKLKEQLNHAHDDFLVDSLEDLEHLRDKQHARYRKSCTMEAKELDAVRKKALEDMGLSFDEAGVLKHDQSVPQLLNISDDPHLEGSLVFYLHANVDNKVGSDKECNLVLSGLGVMPFMCLIRNQNNEAVTLTRLTKSGEMLGGTRQKEESTAGRVLVNGQLANNQCSLRHTDRLIFGHSSCFRLVFAADKQKRKTLICSGAAENASWVDALREVVHDDSPEFPDYCAMIDSIQDRIGTSTANEFISDFKQAWPLVAEGNMITSELRGDEITYKIEVTFDAKTFSSDYPELIVRAYHKNHETNELEVKDVFELPQYLERLEIMRQLYFTGHLEGEKGGMCARLRAPSEGTRSWGTKSWNLGDRAGTKEGGPPDDNSAAGAINNMYWELGLNDPWATYTPTNVKQFKDMAINKVAELEAELRQLRRNNMFQPKLARKSPAALDEKSARARSSEGAKSGNGSNWSKCKIVPYTTRGRSAANQAIYNSSNKSYRSNRGWTPGGG